MAKQVSYAVLGFLAGLSGATAAHANTFAATELSYDSALLSQFNLINLGNYTSSSRTEGRVLVGGSATGTSTATLGCAVNCTVGNSSLAASSNPSVGSIASVSTASGPNPNQGYGALTVFGNLTGGFNVQGGGDVNVQGNLQAGSSAAPVSLNGKGGLNLGGNSALGTSADNPTEFRLLAGTTQLGTLTNATAASYQPQTSLGAVFPFGTTSNATFNTPLGNLAQGLANLPGTPGFTQALPPAQTSSPFVAGADFIANGKNYGVVTTTLANLVAEGTSFAGVKNGTTDAATFVIVTGNAANAVLPTLNYTDSKVIYDFVNATSLVANSLFNGSILAPLATITQGTGGILNGSIVVASITQTNELHQGNLFTGDLSGLINTTYPGTRSQVPEPASIALLAVGLAGLATLRRVSR